MNVCKAENGDLNESIVLLVRCVFVWFVLMITLKKWHDCKRSLAKFILCMHMHIFPLSHAHTHTH